MSTLTSICYHYLERGDEFKSILGHPFDSFKRHISSLRNRFTFIDPGAVLNGQFQGEKEYLLLTFDDGLQEHHAVGPEELTALSEERAEVPVSDGLDHLDGDDVVVDPCEAAVILAADRHPR